MNEKFVSWCILAYKYLCVCTYMNIYAYLRTLLPSYVKEMLFVKKLPSSKWIKEKETWKKTLTLLIKAAKLLGLPANLIDGSCRKGKVPGSEQRDAGCLGEAEGWGSAGLIIQTVPICYPICVSMTGLRNFDEILFLCISMNASCNCY